MNALALPSTVAFCLLIAAASFAEAAPRGVPGALPGNNGVVVNPFYGESFSPPPSTPSVSCDAGAAQYAVGRRATSALVREIESRSGATMIRLVREGAGLTREFLAGRITVFVDRRKRIAAIRCG